MGTAELNRAMDSHPIQPKSNRVFSYDIAAGILVFHYNELRVMLVYGTKSILASIHCLGIALEQSADTWCHWVQNVKCKGGKKQILTLCCSLSPSPSTHLSPVTQWLHHVIVCGVLRGLLLGTVSNHCLSSS